MFHKLNMKRLLVIFSFLVMSFMHAQEMSQVRNTKIESVPVAKSLRQFALRFNILPREIKTVAGRTKIKLVATLQPFFGIDGAEIVAELRGRKKKFIYSSQLKKFINDHSLKAAMFKTIEDYLVMQIREGEANPSLLLANLKTYLDNGMAPTFTVTFRP